MLSVVRLRHMVAAVATATRWTPVWKKSRYDSTATSPPCRSTAWGCSCDSFSSACTLHSANYTLLLRVVPAKSDKVCLQTSCKLQEAQK